MKKLALVLVMMSFGFAQAQNTSANAPATGVDAGKPSKEQRMANKTALQSERDGVASACSEESKAAGCGDKVVGKGLLKCLHEFKKASKDSGKEFKVSDGCKASMKTLKEERKKLKGKKS